MGHLKPQMNVHNTAGNYGANKKFGAINDNIPNDVQMQMELGPDRKHEKWMLISQNPHIGKYFDFNYERDDPANDRAPRRRPEREEGVSIPEYILEIREGRNSLAGITAANDNISGDKKRKEFYNNPYQIIYGGAYGEQRRKREEKPPYLRLIEDGKSEKNKDYSGEPADNVARQVEKHSKKTYNSFSITQKVKALYESGRFDYVFDKAKSYMDFSRSQGAKAYNFMRGSGDHLKRAAYNALSWLINYSMPVEYGREEEDDGKVVYLNQVAEQRRVEEERQGLEAITKKAFRENERAA